MVEQHPVKLPLFVEGCLESPDMEKEWISSQIENYYYGRTGGRADKVRLGSTTAFKYLCLDLGAECRGARDSQTWLAASPGNLKT